MDSVLIMGDCFGGGLAESLDAGCGVVDPVFVIIKRTAISGLELGKNVACSMCKRFCQPVWVVVSLYF